MIDGACYVAGAIEVAVPLSYKVAVTGASPPKKNCPPIDAVLNGPPVCFSPNPDSTAPPEPRVIAVRPPRPEPEDEDEYAWVDGYWYPVEGHYYWHRGYWTRPPYAGAIWIVPRYEGGRYYGGYWSGPRGRFEHNPHDNGKHKGWYKKRPRRSRSLTWCSLNTRLFSLVPQPRSSGGSPDPARPRFRAGVDSTS